MAATPPEEVRAILRQLEPILTRWHEAGTLGEVAIVCGQNEWEPEERPRKRHRGVKRKIVGKPIVRVG